MSIIIKKKPKYNKKKLIQRIGALVFVYFFSFFLLYAFFGKRDLEVKTEKIPPEITYKNEGEKFLSEGKYPETIEYFLRVIEENPEDFLAMNKLGIAYKKINQIDKAKFYFFKSKELAPKYVDNYIQIASLYITQGDFLSAENMIDMIPTEKKQDFIAKGNILLELASYEPQMEDKIIHYTRALNYFKKYDKVLYEKTVDKLLVMYFELAKYYVASKDKESAINVYNNILKYKNTCEINNKLALNYMNISDEKIVEHAKKAVSMAKTQDEKRMTKQNLINLKYYFEKKYDNSKSALMSSFLLMLDESSILVDEKYTIYSVTDESFDYVEKDEKIYPEMIFSIKNQSDKEITFLKAKIVLYINPEKILDKKEIQLITKDIPLKAKEKSSPYTIRLNKNLNFDQINNYVIALSLSQNGKNWQLHRLYKKEKE